MPHTGIANLQFYLLETDKAQPSPSCSRNNLFAASSAVLLVTSGLSSLISWLRVQIRDYVIGCTKMGQRALFRVGSAVDAPHFSRGCERQHAYRLGSTNLVSNIGVNSALQG